MLLMLTAPTQAAEVAKHNTAGYQRIYQMIMQEAGRLAILRGIPARSPEYYAELLASVYTAGLMDGKREARQRIKERAARRKVRA